MDSSEITEQETEMIELLRAHPALAKTVREVLGVIAGESDGPGTADAAEARLVEPLRELGRELLNRWAASGEQLTGERLKAGDAQARVRAKKSHLALRLRHV